MKITIVPSDQTIIIDGLAIRFVAPLPVDPAIHAVQWNGAQGHVEFNDGRPNQNISGADLADFQSLIDLYQTRKQEMNVAEEARRIQRQKEIDRIRPFEDQMAALAGRIRAYTVLSDITELEVREYVRLKMAIDLGLGRV